MAENTREGNFILKGIIHCHTKLSFDSQVPLSNLCEKLQRQRFNFVALTEHTEGVTPEDYERFVAECKRESSGTLIAIPGLEIRCNDGTEIAGIGISKFIEGGTPDEVVSQIHNQGGYAVLVHPLKLRKWNGLPMDCDAIEVMNGKVEGTLAPNIGLLRHVRKYRQRGKQIHAIFGLDSHGLDKAHYIWTECEVSVLTSRGIIESLKKGQFISRVLSGKVLSSGAVKTSDFIKFFTLRIAYIFWNKVLEVIPEPFLGLVIRLSRPVVGAIKRDELTR